MSALTSSGPGGCKRIGELLFNRSTRRRMDSIVRHGSVARSALTEFFKAFDPARVGPILKAAERFEILTKQKGRKNGALGYTGLRVLKALLEFLDYRTGRLEPSYLAIARKAGLSVSAVAAALKRLVLHGFLCMVRRYEPTGNTGGGPQVRQITNAYAVSFPAEAAASLKPRSAPPLPADEVQRRRDARAERERLICQLPDWQQPIVRADVSQPELEAALSSLGRAVFAATEPEG